MSPPREAPRRSAKRRGRLTSSGASVSPSARNPSNPLADPALRQALARGLRSIYAAIPHQPLPERMMLVLNQLQHRSAAERSLPVVRTEAQDQGGPRPARDEALRVGGDLVPV